MDEQIDAAATRLEGQRSPDAPARSRSISVGFKRTFTAPEREEIERKRREMRERLTAAG